MLKRLAADALGLSDIGSVIKPQDYDKVDSDDYIMHEDNERIFFLIKSKSDEYCFTNLALLHLDGTNAVSKKRTLHRYSYYEHAISDVLLETAGTVDLDVEIKFTMGAVHHSIDVRKNHLAEVKDLYKALIRISELAKEGEMSCENARASANLAAAAIGRVMKSESSPADQFGAVNQAAFDWLQAARKHKLKDYGPIFERYINY